MMQKMVTRVFRNLATTRCSIRRRFDGIALKGGDGLHLPVSRPPHLANSGSGKANRSTWTQLKFADFH